MRDFVGCSRVETVGGKRVTDATTVDNGGLRIFKGERLVFGPFVWRVRCSGNCVGVREG